MTIIQRTYVVHEAKGEIVPIIISSPHSGTLFPDHLKFKFHKHLLALPLDTDWYINKLYDFAPVMGITLIEANYSRYLIDLNRNPDNKKLYDDGRTQSALLPLKTFDGESIYIPGHEPKQNDVQERLALYYWPYYKQVRMMIDKLKQQFKHVLFFDAHSIRHHIPSISDQSFPNLILSDNHNKTASLELIKPALDVLQRQQEFSVSHNNPFRGGHLTQYFGSYSQGVHALQLEMCQSNYMDEMTLKLDKEKSLVVKQLLKKLFSKLINTLNEMT